MTDLRQQSEQHEIQQQGHDNVGLVRPENRNEIGFFQKHFTKSNAKKVAIVIVAVLLIFSSISMLLSKQTIFGRDPIKMIDNTAPQIGCPEQSSFRSFYYFHEMMKMIRDEKLADDKFLRWKMEEKKIGGMTFYQAQKLFKVMKTIQLSRDFANSEDNNDKYSVQQKYINKLNDQANLTQFFPEATNQHRCASCYAFPVTATIQALYKKIKNVTIKLSEQQIIDCIYDNPLINTCDQGNMTKAFQYAMNVGLVQEKYYHYRSIEGVSYPCKKQIVNNQTIPKYKISDFQVLPKGACNGIQQFLQRGYPVASMINAQKLSQFNNKKDLIFSECNKYTLNHAVVIVGQVDQNKIKKSQDNKQAQQSQSQDKNMLWIVRNSWGSSFGNNGYFYMAGKNKCGTCSQSIIPYLKFNEHDQVVKGGQMPQQI